jgi:hypothetical protein
VEGEARTSRRNPDRDPGDEITGARRGSGGGHHEQDFVTKHQSDLAALRSILTPYAEDGLQPDASDRELVAAVDALRRLLELAYGQRITFRGEARPKTGIRIDSKVGAGNIEGYVAAVRAGTLPPGTRIKAETVVRDVKPAGSVLGVDVSAPPSS